METQLQAALAGRRAELRVKGRQLWRPRSRRDLAVFQGSGPQPSWHQGPASWRTVSPRTGVGGVQAMGSGT